jgi:hypothetical protein
MAAAAIESKSIATENLKSSETVKNEFGHLAINSIIGFSGNFFNVYQLDFFSPGSVPHGLVKHPDNKHILYPLGCTVVMQNPHDPSSQTFLQGHTNLITCLAVSKSGKYVASGQTTHMGFQVMKIKQINGH